MSTHPIASTEEWTAARIRLWEKEKELVRLGDELAAARRALPWRDVTEDYVFDTAEGARTLADLFGGRSQLAVYHFMFAPEWQEGCPSCSFVSDHFDGMLPHLAARDVSLVAVSRAPLEKLSAFRKRMGWKFPWVSSGGNRFNHDYGVSFTEEELATGKVRYNYTEKEFPSTDGPGMSVFRKEADGRIFHTYSTYERGVERLMTTYGLLDLMPKGRDEDGLPFTMA
jgi:predicted dithiol-disulfide oxidoreductase (DUF899 family)